MDIWRYWSANCTEGVGSHQRSHDIHVTVVCESYVACKYKAEEVGHS